MYISAYTSSFCQSTKLKFDPFIIVITVSRTYLLIQVAFVDPPKLDFDLRLPADSHGSGLLDYVQGWADAFITDNILSQYVLPDHFFTQIDGGS